VPTAERTGWTAPAAIRIEAEASVCRSASGAGRDSAVMSQSGMKRLLGDKFTIGGEATAAAGGWPRRQRADGRCNACRNAVVFEGSRVVRGISLQGATLRPDDQANRELYGHDVGNREILANNVAAPAAAARLETALDRNSLRETH